MPYFSDRELGARPRVFEEISPQLWGGFVALTQGHIARGDFAERYPDPCPDGRGLIGTDIVAMGQAFLAEIPQLGETQGIAEPRRNERTSTGWPLRADRIPHTHAILDLIELGWAAISVARTRSHHSYFGHDDLSDFDAQAGRTAWLAEVNQLFERNQMAYELTATGQVIRLGSDPLTAQARSIRFATGDGALDELLNRSRAKYLSTAATVRAESLEQLWDAFERMKTLGPGDKKASLTALLNDVATSAAMRTRLEDEMKALTEMGNEFRIRHHETDKQPIDPTDVDYLFHRMFAFVSHCLRLDPS